MHRMIVIPFTLSSYGHAFLISSLDQEPEKLI
jgi:hypothetical protein